MPDTNTEQEQVYELSDVDVLSVGLVMNGANREEFFLVKSADGTETPVADTPAPKPNLWERIKAFVKGAVEEEVEAQFPEDETPTTELGESETPVESPAKGTETSETTPTETASTPNTEYLKTEAGDDKTAGANAPEETPMAENTIVQEAEKGAQSPATVQMTLPPEVVAKLEELGALKAQVAEISDLKARVEKAEARAAAETEKAERQSYLEKATKYMALPVAATELADHLYKLAKASPDEAKWVESLLNAADNALVTAGIFKEFGTSTTPETATGLEKAQAMVTKGEAKDIAEALLKLTPAEQATLLNQSRSRAGKK